MEGQHNRDLEAMQLEAQAKEAAPNARVLQHQMTLSRKLQELESRCEKMQRADSQIWQRIEADRQQFEKEKQDAQKQLEEANRLAQVHAALQSEQWDELKKFIRSKDEDENKALEIFFQNQKMQLIERQQLELQKQQAKEMLKIEHSSEMNKRINELESELEGIQAMNSAMLTKERVANDQLEEARAAARKVLYKYGSEDSIGLRMMGCINKGPWVDACKERFKLCDDRGKLVMSTSIEWERRMKDPNYHPYKYVQLQGDNWKRVVDEEDAHIKKLKEDWGPEVMQTVVNAFFEMEDCNASGRYQFAEAWDYEKNQRVLLKDLLFYLRDLLDSGCKLAKAERKRARAI